MSHELVPAMKQILMLPGACGEQVVTVADASERAAEFMATTGEIYRRGDTLVRLVDGRLVILSITVLQSLLFTYMNVMHFSGVGPNRKVAPAPEIKESTMRVIFGSHYIRKLVKGITLVLDTCQMVLSSGKLIVMRPGYNPECGGAFVVGQAVPEVVPVSEAVKAIKGLFVDFQFATASDYSRAIAAVFCVGFTIGGIYERHPLLIFEANDSQSGKTLLWAMICAIFGLRFGTVAQKRGGVGSLDEALMEKLVSGVACILLDNLRGKFDSPFLEAALTLEDGSIDARVPGVRAIPVDPSHVVFGLTSNGVEITIDLGNRSLMIRIRKQPPDHEFKEWKDRQNEAVGIREHIIANQTFYLGCVHAIFRDWWANGAQRLPCKDHSFRPCIGALDFIVQKYFGMPPLLDGHLEALDRASKPGLSWLRLIALKAAASWFVVDWSATRLAERCVADGIPILGSTPVTDIEAAAKLVGIAMGQVFAGTNTVTIDDVKVERSLTADSEGRERKVYSFKTVRA